MQFNPLSHNVISFKDFFVQKVLQVYKKLGFSSINRFTFYYENAHSLK
jgi:hypothetical protein